MLPPSYPYKAWTLTTSFKLKEVEITGEYIKDQWMTISTGSIIHVSDVACSKEAAINWGRTRLEKQQAALNKKQLAIIKRLANLEKQEP